MVSQKTAIVALFLLQKLSAPEHFDCMRSSIPLFILSVEDLLAVERVSEDTPGKRRMAEREIYPSLATGVMLEESNKQMFSEQTDDELFFQKLLTHVENK